jgi:hypothetical protein
MLTVARADASGKLTLEQTLQTPPQAAPGAQPQRPQMVPVSFKVVVYKMTGLRTR